ncbi:MAG: fused MFS/spermidine synthase [Verrucomicrobiota bacterium]|jgi:spermidine synthase
MFNRHSTSDRLLLLAFFSSGFAALGYELLWTRLLSLALGSEMMGVLGVLAGFFGGMVGGAYYLNNHAHKAKNPAVFFSFLELFAAVYAWGSPHFLLWLARTLPPLIGPLAGDNDRLIALGLSLLVSGLALLPATFCMGATLAYVSEARRRVHAAEAGAKNLGRLYFANTLGATLGVFTSIYFIFPSCGMATGAAWLSLTGIIAALLAYGWHRSVYLPSVAKPDAPAGHQNTKGTIAHLPVKKVYVLLLLTGLAGIGLEVVLVRILAQLFFDTVYTFANLLAVYLLGTAAGAWLCQRRARNISGEKDISSLLAWLIVSIVISTLILSVARPIFDWLRPSGSGLVRNLLAEVILSLLVFLSPTMLMGALFSRLVGELSGYSVGKGYALNTLGSALAPFVFGLFVIHFWGYEAALCGVALVFLLAWLQAMKPLRFEYIGLAAGVFIFLIFFSSKHLETYPLSEGWVLVDKRETLYGTVRVLEPKGETGTWGQPLRLLMIHRGFVLGGGDGLDEMRMGHMSLLLQPKAEHMLYLGVSTGTCLGAVKQYPLKQVDAVEIVPQIVDMMHWFRDINFDVQNDSRVRLVKADARRFTSASHDKYDLIVADIFQPGFDGAGSLYSLEHFRAMRDHLTADGLVAQWVPLINFDTDVLKSLVRTFITVFPESHAFLATYNANSPLLLLVSKKTGHPLKIDIDYLTRNLQRDKPAGRVIYDVSDFMGEYVTDAKGLSEFSRSGVLNTDLNPYILFHAPREAYLDRRESDYTSLEAFLKFRSPPDPSLVCFPDKSPADNAYASIKNTWQVAGKLMEANLEWAKQGNGPVTLEIVQKLGEAYRLDPNFEPVGMELAQIALASPSYRQIIRTTLNERDRMKLDEAE